MISKYAMVIEGQVVNICLWDGTDSWTAPEGATMVNVDGVYVDIGWSFVDNVFSPPVIEEEQTGTDQDPSNP